MFDIPKIEAKPMPKGWKSPFKVPLYQVLVQPTHGGPPILVGPAMSLEAIGELHDAIKKNILLGREKNWSNPTLVCVKP